MTDATVLSYVASVRANSYLYSEFNYYDGCKMYVTRKVRWSFQIIWKHLLSCIEDNQAVATTRTQAVASNCKFSLRALYKTLIQTLFYYDNRSENRCLYNRCCCSALWSVCSGAQKDDSNVDAGGE